MITSIATDHAGCPGDGPGVTGLIGSRGAGGRSGSGRRRDKPGRRADRPPSGRGRPHQGLEGRRTDINASPRQIPQATCKTPRCTATMGRQWTPCPTRSAENSRQFPKTGNVAEHNQPLHKTTIDKKARLSAIITRFEKTADSPSRSWPAPRRCARSCTSWSRSGRGRATLRRFPQGWTAGSAGIRRWKGSASSPRRTVCFGPRTAAAGDDETTWRTVSQSKRPPDPGQLLLDRRAGGLAHSFLQPHRDVNRFDVDDVVDFRIPRASRKDDALRARRPGGYSGSGSARRRNPPRPGGRHRRRWRWRSERCPRRRWRTRPRSGRRSSVRWSSFWFPAAGWSDVVAMAADIAPAADQAGAPGICTPAWLLRRTASIASTADPEDVRRARDGMKVVPRVGRDARDRELVPDTCLGAASVAFHGRCPSRAEAYIKRRYVR